MSGALLHVIHFKQSFGSIHKVVAVYVGPFVFKTHKKNGVKGNFHRKHNFNTTTACKLSRQRPDGPQIKHASSI